MHAAFANFAPKLWNTIPVYIIKPNHKQSFKRKLKTHFRLELTGYFISLRPFQCILVVLFNFSSL